MTLSQFTMMKMFLAALGMSALSKAIFRAVRPDDFDAIQKKRATDPSHAGVLTAGGLILGTGMAISGSCPGSVYVQLGAQIPSALPVWGGVLVGTLVTLALIKPLWQESKPKVATIVPVRCVLHAAVGVILIGLAVVLEVFVPERDLQASAWLPTVAGVVVGSLQLPLVLLLRRSLGATQSYKSAIALALYPIRNTRVGKCLHVPAATDLSTFVFVRKRDLSELPMDTEEVLPAESPSILGGMLSLDDEMRQKPALKSPRKSHIPIYDPAREPSPNKSKPPHPPKRKSSSTLPAPKENEANRDAILLEDSVFVPTTSHDDDDKDDNDPAKPVAVRLDFPNSIAIVIKELEALNLLHKQLMEAKGKPKQHHDHQVDSSGDVVSTDESPATTESIPQAHSQPKSPRHTISPVQAKSPKKTRHSKHPDAAPPAALPPLTAYPLAAVQDAYPWSKFMLQQMHQQLLQSPHHVHGASTPVVYVPILNPAYMAEVKHSPADKHLQPPSPPTPTIATSPSKAPDHVAPVETTAPVAATSPSKPIVVKPRPGKKASPKRPPVVKKHTSRDLIESITGLDSCVRIQYLYLQNNRISSLDGSLRHFSFLKELRLYNNKLQDLHTTLKLLEKFRKKCFDLISETNVGPGPTSPHTTDAAKGMARAWGMDEWVFCHLRKVFRNLDSKKLGCVPRLHISLHGWMCCRGVLGTQFPTLVSEMLDQGHQLIWNDQPLTEESNISALLPLLGKSIGPDPDDDDEKPRHLIAWGAFSQVDTSLCKTIHDAQRGAIGQALTQKHVGPNHEPLFWAPLGLAALAERSEDYFDKAKALEKKLSVMATHHNVLFHFRTVNIAHRPRGCFQELKQQVHVFTQRGYHLDALKEQLSSLSKDEFVLHHREQQHQTRPAVLRDSVSLYSYKTKGRHHVGDDDVTGASIVSLAKKYHVKSKVRQTFVQP
ncbi:hypothetical protein DYB32_006863 [Aphanomyces invadans]|uniref:Uncharacterized protein n=1 Tax=Aphanomyces invadans TaxID=157072 RepID=A0A418AQB1_9STRA|nr:hypothetical protein DYB32_006863 [Aphanomyces invadans]